MVSGSAKSGNSNCRGRRPTPSPDSTTTRLNRHFQLSPTGKTNRRYTNSKPAPASSADSNPIPRFAGVHHDLPVAAVAERAQRKGREWNVDE